MSSLSQIGLAVVMLDPSGENAITVVPGANAHVRGFVVDGNVLCQLEITDEAIREARAQARWLCVNAAPARPLVVEADLVVANDVSDGVFGADTDRVTFVSADGAEPQPLLPKSEVARRLVEKIAQRLG